MSSYTAQYKKWRDARIADGLCGSCGKKRNLYACRCDTCQSKVRDGIRRLQGSKPRSSAHLVRKPING